MMKIFCYNITTVEKKNMRGGNRTLFPHQFYVCKVQSCIFDFS